jgi:hypothetical protein
VDEQSPFADVRLLDGGGFSIPELKWRELVFIGALRREGALWVRDPRRPLPPFRIPDLFPEGAAFEIRMDGRRVAIRSARGTGPASRG